MQQPQIEKKKKKILWKKKQANYFEEKMRNIVIAILQCVLNWFFLLNLYF